ncbi:MAG: polyhydroxyalkanoate synthesis repressor PhaR [Pseudomonadota bacterium]
MEHQKDIAASEKPSDGTVKPPIIVKKYANRRLYNTASSSYVTLDNLAAMVREGQDFVVQDAKSGDDITRSVLTQIIFEEEAHGRAPMLPIGFLRQLIRLYGDSLQGYVPGYLELTMQTFARNQENFRSHMERTFGATPGFKQFEAITRANMEMFRNAMGVFAPFAANAQADEEGQDLAAGGTPGADPARRSDAAGAGATPSADELAALKRQLEEMQRRVDALVKNETDQA